MSYYLKEKYRIRILEICVANIKKINYRYRKKYITMGLVSYIKKRIAIYRVNRWSKSRYIPSEKRIRSFANGHDRIFKDEMIPFIKNAYIKRRCDMNSVCVDLYWIIKPSKGKKHIYVVHKRCDWDEVLAMCKRGDKISLPKAIYYAFEKMTSNQ